MPPGSIPASANPEAIRLQTALSDGETELLCEGDTYPRPRAWVSAKLLEFYDAILTADGKTHGILKYMLDYTAAADFETGYIDRHLKNAPHRRKAEEWFADGEALGLNVFEHPMAFSKAELDEVLTVNRLCRNGHLPTVAQEFCVDNSLPITYENREGACVIFGESAHFADEVLSPEITLSRPYAALEVYGNQGELQERRVLLKEEIPPYGFAFLKLTDTKASR